jgi:hypothetical protein
MAYYDTLINSMQILVQKLLSGPGLFIAIGLAILFLSIALGSHAVNKVDLPTLAKVFKK